MFEFEDVASVSFPLRSSEDHCIATITIEGPRFQFDVEDNPLLADWVSTVTLLEAECRKTLRGLLRRLRSWRLRGYGFLEVLRTRCPGASRNF